MSEYLEKIVYLTQSDYDTVLNGGSITKNGHTINSLNDNYLYITEGNINVTNLTGILTVPQGGTGANNESDARTNLGLGAAATKGVVTSISTSTDLPTAAAVKTYVDAASDHIQAVNKGGTNLTSYTTGDIIYASGSTTLSKLSGNTTTTNKFLRSVAATSGTAVAPTWAAVTATDVGLGNVENTKLSTWTGSTALTTLGTISTGTWQGTAIASSYVGNLPASKITSGTIAVAQGGTNIASYTIGDILYASASTTLSKLGGNTTTTRKFLRSVAATSGTAVAPAWDTVTKTDVGLSNVENTKLSTWTGSTSITTLGTIGSGTWQGTAISSTYIGSHNHSASNINEGTLAVARGGTNIGSYTTGDILYASGGTTLSKLNGNTTTTSKFLRSKASTSGTAAAPSWVALEADDIPNLAASKINSGTFDTARIPSVTNAMLSNSSVTIAGQTISLGGELTRADLLGNLNLSSAMVFKGVAGQDSQTITDGGTEIVVLNGAQLTPSAGDVVLQNDTEFVWSGSVWQALGSGFSFKIKQEAYTYTATSTNSTTDSIYFLSAIGSDINGNIWALSNKLPTGSSSTAGIVKLGASGGAAAYSHDHTTSDITNLSSWTGGSSIATVGTITTGTWQGTSVKVGYGGTGTTTAPTKGGIIYASSTSAYASTGAGSSGQLLVSGGTGAPSWSSGLSYSASNKTLTISTDDSSQGFAIDTSGYRYSYIRFLHGGVAKGFLRYDAGNATNITTSSRFGVMEYSPNTTANASTTGYYEAYLFPRPTAGLSANATYYVLTTKGFVLSGTTLTITTNPDP